MTRWFVYKPQHVRVTFVLDNASDLQRWTFLAFQDAQSKQPLSADDAKKRLAKRVPKGR